MRFLKLFVLPIVILGVVAIVTMFVYADLENGTKILLVPLLGELSLLTYFWKFKLNQHTKSTVFFVYETFLVLLVFIVKIIATYLYARGIITWMPYSVIYFIFVGIVFLMSFVLKILYGGVNKSLKMQYKGEGNLATMREVCLEIIFVLEQNKHETSKQIRILKQVLEAIEFSDPVTHKKVLPLEKAIITKLEDILKLSKKKSYKKIKDVTNGSNGVLELLDNRNNALRNRK